MQIAIWLLRLGPALIMVVFGINQMINPEPWFEYIPEFVKKMNSPKFTMRSHSLGNIVFGLFLASGLHPLVGAWIAFLWFLSIVPFAFMDKWKTGMRDLTITISLLALIFLTRAMH